MYFGGVAASIRKEVWPFLLGHYQFNTTEKCRLEVGQQASACALPSASQIWLIPGFSVSIQIDQQMRARYEQTVSDWRGCEAIVRQREREKHAEALARCSSGVGVERGPVQRDSTISTDASLTVVLMQPCWLYRSGISKEILVFTDISFFLVFFQYSHP